MTSSPRPIASKIWAPVYEATVDTPIFDMILSRPLPSALIRLSAAFFARDRLEHPAADHVLDRLERQVRVDRGGAVTDQQGDVVALAGVARLHDQPGLGPGPLPDQVVVHGAGEQQRRDRRQPWLVQRLRGDRGRPPG